MSVMEPQQKNIEETVVILDYMPEGKSIGKPTGPVVQLISERAYTLYEVLFARNQKPSITLTPLKMATMREVRASSKIEREQIIGYNDLGDVAQEQIKEAIELIVDKNEETFIKFLNNANPITTRLHQLELLPGIGKKYLWDIIKQRKIKPFSSFQDLADRVKISDIKKAIVRRIIVELTQKDEKYYLFVPRQRAAENTSEEQGWRPVDERTQSRFSSRRPY